MGPAGGGTGTAGGRAGARVGDPPVPARQAASGPGLRALRGIQWGAAVCRCPPRGVEREVIAGGCRCVGRAVLCVYSNSSPREAGSDQPWRLLKSVSYFPVHHKTVLLHRAWLRAIARANPIVRPSQPRLPRLPRPRRPHSAGHHATPSAARACTRRDPSIGLRAPAAPRAPPRARPLGHRHCTRPPRPRAVQPRPVGSLPTDGSLHGMCTSSVVICFRPTPGMPEFSPDTFVRKSPSHLHLLFITSS